MISNILSVERHKTTMSYLDSIANNCIDFNDVPIEIVDQSFCDEAVRRNCNCIATMDDKFKTREVCEIAVSKCPSLIKYFPKNSNYRNLHLQAVEADGMMLKHIPKCFNDRGICLAAVTQNPKAKKYVPRELRPPSAIDRLMNDIRHQCNMLMNRLHNQFKYRRLN